MTLTDPRLTLSEPELRLPVSPALEVTPGQTARVGAWSGVIAIAVAVGWLGFVGIRTLAGARDLTTALATAQGRTVGPALIAVVAILLVAERLWPAVPRPLLSRGHLVDAGYLVLFALVVVPLLTLVETGFAVEMSRHARFLILSRLPLAPQVVVVGAILVGIDAMNWGAHVANHRSASLWRLHALHHSQEDMSVLTTFRTHPLVHATYLGALLPALVLGASGAVPAVAIIVYGCLVTLPHANLPWTLGPFGRIVVSPAYHRLHHARVPLDSRGTVNFGFVLVCWDQMSRRAAYPTRGEAVATGIAGRPVPIEQAARGGAWRVVLTQLAQPFRIHSGMDAS